MGMAFETRMCGVGPSTTKAQWLDAPTLSKTLTCASTPDRVAAARAAAVRTRIVFEREKSALFFVAREVSQVATPLPPPTIN